MTVTGDIISDDGAKVGYVQFDPYDYEYNGDDPDGLIDDYLSGEAAEDRFPVDYVWDDGEEEQPKHRMQRVIGRLKAFDEIWLVKLPHDPF